MARKQEQEPASDEVTEVAPGVLRLQLPIDFTGLGHVNMYALVDDRGVAVVDPGLPGGGAWRNVVDRLGRADLKVADVHTVVVTHSHPDHFGSAGRLAEEAGAALVAHEGFRVPWLPETFPDLIELDADGFPLGVPAASHGTAGGHRHEPPGGPDRADEDGPRWRGQATWNRNKTFTPPFRQRVGLKVARKLQPKAFASPVPTVRLADGESIRLAGREWFAAHTPGHTEDHLCLHDPQEGVLLTGDHVLPTITPHISGMGSTPHHDPLAAYLDALDRVAAMPVGTALPAHGHPFDDLAGRVSAIKDHHDRRLEQSIEIVAALGGRATVEQVAQQMFSERHWGLMAESETYAHLEHLRHAGRAAVRWVDGEVEYQLVEANA